MRFVVDYSVYKCRKPVPQIEVFCYSSKWMNSNIDKYGFCSQARSLCDHLKNALY